MKVQNEQELNGRKVIVGFKCSPALKLSLCNQAEKLGITLSSHVEVIVSAYENKESESVKLSEQVKRLKERIAFYEESPLKELYSENKGKTISFINTDKKKETITIKSMDDVFTVIINSFKTDK